jgi:hypothetical protein
MLPILIILFVIFAIAYFLCGEPAVKHYNGGYIEPKNTDIIRNKLFFNYNDHAEQIFKIINKNNEPIKYYSDIKDRLAFHNEKFTLIRTSTHIGQLKLVLSEIEFLTEILPSNKTSEIVVYAGSAPSNKIYYLHTLFPNVKFILVDPNEHFIFYPDGNHYESKHSSNVVYIDTKNKNNKYKIKNRNVLFYDGKNVKKVKKESINANINTYGKKNLLDFIKKSQYTFYIIEDYFTNDLAELFKELNPYFISDIRSNIHEMIPMIEKLNKIKVTPPKVDSNDEFPSDLDICWNNALHLNWVCRLQPKKSMLKFRLPWFIQDKKEFEYYSEFEPYSKIFEEAKDNGIDFIGDFMNNQHRFLNNEGIYVQAFPGIVSTESRLICSNYKDIILYDAIKYDDCFHYYNWFYRQFAFIDHGFMDAKLGIDGCNDCALMIKIFREYLQKYKMPDDPKKHIAKLMQTIHRRLRNEFHGEFTTPYTTTKQILEKQELFIMTDLYNSYKDNFSKFKY